MQTSDEQIPGTVTPDGGVDTRAAAGGGKLRELAEMPVGRLLWKYSLPAVVGMLVVQLYNVIDRIVIGQVVGAKAIAGLAITFPVMNIATALGVLVGAGASARISLFLGAGDTDRARKVLGNSLTLTLIIGTIYIGLFAVFLSPILRLFGADEATLPYARDFMAYILPGLMMTNLTFSFNNMMRASGYPMKAMATMFVGCGLNILLAPLFVWALGLGIKGAAIATDISMTVSMLFVMRHFCVRRHGPVVFTRGIYRLDPRLIWGIIGIGAAPSIVNVASCVINIFLNNALKDYGGYEALAAAGIFVTYTSMLCCIVIGICQGMQPVIGFNYGNGQPDRVRHTFWLAALAGTVVTVAGWTGGMAVPGLISRAFVADVGAIAVAEKALSTSMICFWMVGMQIIATEYFQSIGKIGLSIFLSLIRQVIFFLPLMLLLPHWFGLDGIWYTFPTSDTLATVVTVALMWRALRRLPSECRPAATPDDGQ